MMKRLPLVFIFILEIFLVFPSHSQELTVFDVRQPVSMDDSQTSYQDFYINGGREAGLRVGSVVTVSRRFSLYDAYKNASPGDLLVPVGRLKIIHVQKGLSVARLHSIFSRKNRPVLEYDYIMVGDRLDLSKGTADAPSEKNKRAASTSSKSEGPQEELSSKSLKNLPTMKKSKEPLAGSKEMASKSPEVLIH